jgi:hypothetical protein
MKLQIVNGNIDRLFEVCAELDSSKRWSVEISERKDNKTLAQLRTVYGWFRYISTTYAEAGGKYYLPETWKYHLKDRFGLTVEKEMFNGVRTEMKSLADYNIQEMSKFMDDVNHFVGSEFQIFVPLPGEHDDIS